MLFRQILLLLTGLTLFLLGMFQLNSEMQRIFSLKIRRYIKALVKKPIYGVLSGLFATGIFQSSATTIIIVMGMVSAGLISFFNSLGVVLGADIGTTITAQLVAFKITTIAPIFILIGALIWLVGKDKKKFVGQAIFYFGLLFFGLSLMGSAIEPFKNSPIFINLFKERKNPLLGILYGFLFTTITQSSSVTTSILVLLGQKGLITIQGALPIILGANIGSTTTVLLASIGSGINGKRTALSHFLFKFIGVFVFLPLIPFYLTFLKHLTANVAQQVAFGHFFFNLFVVLIFFFFLKPFSKGIEKIFPGKENVLPLWPEYLDYRYVSEPDKAFNSAVKELKREALITRRMLVKASSLVFNFKPKIMRDISYIELVVDNLQKEIMLYLDKISEQKLTRNQIIKLVNYSPIVDSIERIGDQATNIAKLAHYKKVYNVEFSQDAFREIHDLSNLVLKNVNNVIVLFETHSLEKINEIFSCEDHVDEMILQMRKNHFTRLFNDVCKAESGQIFGDLLVCYERISDQCTNVARYVKEIINFDLI